MGEKRLQRLTIIMLSILLIVSAAFSILTVPQVQTAFAESKLEQKTVWGGVDIAEEYYNNSSNMDIKSVMNANFDTTKLSKAKPIKIAIIDTGLSINKDNEELFMGLIPIDQKSETKDWMAYNVKDNTSGRDAVKDIEDDVDGAYHGTSVASIIAMQIKAAGLQDYIKLIPIKANEGPKSNQFSPNTFRKAIQKATELQVDVINVSLGILNSGNSSSGTTGWFNNPYMQDDLTKAAQTAVIVAAAGNDNARYDNSIIKRESHAFFPAVYENVLSVMGSDEENKKYGSSNYGEYDVVAPAKQIYAYTLITKDKKRVPGFGHMNGTSMAAPLVSAFAAMYKVKLATIFSNDKMPSANIISKTISKTSKEQILMPVETVHVQDGNKIVDKQKQYQLNKIDCKTLIEREDYSDGFEYLDPTGMYLEIVSHEGFDKMGNSLVGELSDELEVTLKAKLEPIDLIDPSREDNIIWYVQYADQRTVNIGTGSKITFKPTEGGDQLIVCAYKLGDKYLTRTLNIKAVYQEFDISRCRVTTKDKIHLSQDDDAIKNQNETTYQNDIIVLGLTGLQHVDKKDLLVRWYVDGKYVAEGFTFEYKPKTFGRQRVQASVQNIGEQEHAPEKLVPGVLDLDVKCLMEKPLAIFSSVAILSIILIAIILYVVIVQRKKWDRKIK